MTPPTPPHPKKKSSRAATPRPRRIAGAGSPSEPTPPTDETVEQPVEESSKPEPEVESEEHEPEPWPDESPEDGDGASVFSSPRLTKLLLRVAAVLAAILIAESAWAAIREVSEDDPAKPDKVAEGSIAVPDGRPVLPTELVVQEGVETAAKAVQTLVSRTFDSYDAEVEAALALLTPAFAEEYEETTNDVRDEFIARKTTVQVRVTAQGVVRANDTELQALVFIDQYVIRNQGKDPKTSRTPYRALVTMVNTDAGWLVEDLQTK